MNFSEDKFKSNAKIKWDGTQSGQGVATCFGGQMQLALPDKNRQITLLTSNITPYQKSHDFSDLNQWEATTVSNKFPKKMADKFIVAENSLISVVSLESCSYYFWLSAKKDANGNNQYCAIRVNTASGNSIEFATIILDGALPVANFDKNKPASNLATFILPKDIGENSGKIGALIAYTFINSNSPSITSLTFDVSDFDNDGGWRASFGGIDFNSSGSNEGLSALLEISNETGKVEPTINLHYVTNKSHVIMGFFDVFKNKYKPLKNNPKPISSEDVSSGAYMMTDPAGSPLLCMPHQDRPNYSFLYIPLPIVRGDSPFPVAPSDGSQSKIYKNCLLARFIYVGFKTDNSGGNISFETDYWGTFFTIENYAENNSIDDYNEAALLTMVSDTFPYPVPDSSIWNSDSPSGTVAWLVCNFKYLVGHENEEAVEINLGGSTGVKFENKDTVSGIGIQLEGSLSAGFNSLVNHSVEKKQAHSFSITTKGSPIIGSSSEYLHIAGEGAWFGTTPPSSICVDLMLLAGRGASNKNKAAIFMRPKLDSTIVSKGGDFKSFNYTPGNLLSYTEDSIGRNMQSQFSSLNSSEKQEFFINGFDYSELYSENNYIQHISNHFGENCFGAGGNLPYLEFSFSETGMRRSEYQSTSNFRTAASAFVKGEAYAGVGWDVSARTSVGILGFFEVSLPAISSSGFAMAGVEFETTLSSSTGSSDSWGVSLDEYSNPLAPGEAYTVRMYILKPSPLWAMELKHFGFTADSFIDNKYDLINSCPNRILFTVPYISPALTERLKNQFNC